MTDRPVIRRLGFDEYVELDIGHYAFGATPSVRDMDKARARKPYMTQSVGLAAYDGEQAQASCTVHNMSQNVRGSILPMGGVGGVGSLPQGRRRGHVRAMMVEAFRYMHEQEHAVSVLYPFRDSFYERLGYAEYPKTRFAVLDPAQLGPLVAATLPGEIEQRTIGEAFDDWWTYMQACQRREHGYTMFDRSRGLEWRDQNEDWVALVREHGEVTGAMVFKITGYTKQLVTDLFSASTMAARYQLLAWIGRHVDQVKEAVIELGPAEYPEYWFRDLAAHTSTEHERAWPAAMGRVIDLPRLSGIGAGDGEVCVTIVDDYCPWNSGDWTFRGDGGTLTVSSGGTPAGHITIQGLSALVWTGMDPASFVYRGWGDPAPSAQESLRAIFPTAFPFVNEKF